ncbi:MAG: methyltransferase [Clostridia bacterium]|nr:methyltransferase [Clostridia bacterium]
MDKELTKREPLGNGYFAWVSACHTFGTDAVLLANFAAAKPTDRLVDLGTGCGIIPLLMARDGALKSGVGVDLQEEAVALATRSAREAGADRLSFLCADLKDLKGKIPFGAHTLVTCNPPYKAPSAGIQNRGDARRAARHEVACTLRDVVETAAKLLQTSGRFCLCHRPERLAELMALLREYRMEPKRLRLVCQRSGEEPWLVLVEGKRCAHTGLRILPTLYIEENGAMSPETEVIYGVYRQNARNGQASANREQKEARHQ